MNASLLQEASDAHILRLSVKYLSEKANLIEVLSLNILKRNCIVCEMKTIVCG